MKRNQQGWEKYLSFCLDLFLSYHASFVSAKELVKEERGWRWLTKLAGEVRLAKKSEVGKGRKGFQRRERLAKEGEVRRD